MSCAQSLLRLLPTRRRWSLANRGHATFHAIEIFRHFDGLRRVEGRH